MTATDEARPARRRERSTMLLWVLGGLVALALAIGAVVGGLRDPAELDPRRPEGVVQEYLKAVLDRGLRGGRGVSVRRDGRALSRIGVP
jgi:hypothetical protein